MRTEPLTVDEIMGWGPCEDWPRDRVAAVVGKGLAPAAFLAHPELSDADRVWVVARPEVLGADDIKAFAAAVAGEFDSGATVKPGRGGKEATVEEAEGKGAEVAERARLDAREALRPPSLAAQRWETIRDVDLPILTRASTADERAFVAAVATTLEGADALTAAVRALGNPTTAVALLANLGEGG